MTTDIAAVPLLWVAPLALYLLSFVLAFSPRRRVLTHRLALRLLAPAILAATLLTMARAAQPLALVLGVHLLAFFVAATACHGELARLRPAPARLTEFYLVLAVGGALGGALNSLLAPLIFTRPIEYPLAMVLSCVACAGLRKTERSPAGADLPALRNLQRTLDVILPAIVGAFAFLLVQQVPARSTGVALPVTLAFLSVPVLLTATFARRPLRLGLGLAALLVPAMYLPPAHAQLLAVRRSFFGMHRVLRTNEGHINALFHGTTLHGAQRVDDRGQPTRADDPPSYYHAGGPVADLFRLLPPQRQRHIGVIGLGAGSIAAFARPGAEVTFFEIDPVVRWAAEESGDFTFLRDARARGARVEVVMGDARQTLARRPAGEFDVLLMDAFSGDSVPVHLRTREATAMYLAHLRGGGLLALHISNLYLDLRPVVSALAVDARCASLYRDDPDPPVAPTDLELGSRWVVLARDPRSLDVLRQDPRWRPMPVIADARNLWRDDFSNLLGVLRWRRPPA
jgi:spermidine synthase